VDEASPMNAGPPTCVGTGQVEISGQKFITP